MQFLFRQPSMPKPGDLLPGRPEPIVDPAPHFVNGRALTPPYPDGFEIADVGMGCFWGAEKKFWSIPGVWVTAVGYQGGGTPNPTYKEACTGNTGHAEVVRIVFDPSVVSYERLLKTFWESHDPTQGFRQGNDTGTQYRSVIFAHGDAQLATATASRDMYQGELRARGMGRSRPRSARPPSSTSPRTTTSSTWPRTRTGTTVTRPRASPARSGSGSLPSPSPPAPQVDRELVGRRVERDPLDGRAAAGITLERGYHGRGRGQVDARGDGDAAGSRRDGGDADRLVELDLADGLERGAETLGLAEVASTAVPVVA